MGGCISQPKRKKENTKVLADAAVQEQVNNNHKIEVDERPTLKMIQPIIQEQAEQQENQTSHEAKEHEAEIVGKDNEQTLVKTSKLAQIGVPTVSQNGQEQESFQSVRDYFAGLCTEIGNDAEVFQKLAKKRIEIPIT